jgi:hypothetical protein
MRGGPEEARDFEPDLPRSRDRGALGRMSEKSVPAGDSAQCVAEDGQSMRVSAKLAKGDSLPILRGRCFI